MTKKIHTIQSSDKKEFDKEVNQFLESGGELMDGGYQVINNDDGVVYSQVIELKNCEVEFYGNGRLFLVLPLNNDGLCTDWYENGQKKEEINYKNGKRDGLYTQWYENGQKEYEFTYKDDEEDGLFTSWYENGQKKYERTFKDGKEDGLYTQWYENGQKKSEWNRKDGKLICITKKEWNEDGTLWREWNEDGTVKE